MLCLKKPNLWWNLPGVRGNFCTHKLTVRAVWSAVMSGHHLGCTNRLENHGVWHAMYEITWIPHYKFISRSWKIPKNEQGLKAVGTVDDEHKILQWNAKLGSTHSLFDLSLEQNSVLPRMQMLVLPSKQVFDWPSIQYDSIWFQNKTTMMVKCESMYNAICPFAQKCLLSTNLYT